MYRRVITGIIHPGRHEEFLQAVREASSYQEQKGVQATTSLWFSITGEINGFALVSEFDSLSELEKFDNLAADDGRFAELRRRAMSPVVFGTAETELQRKGI
jgi:hypothetical protein